MPDRAKGAVNALKKAGITAGKATDQFGAQDLITRGELAISIQKGFQLKGNTALSFKDVAPQYDTAVQALASNSITKGVSTTEFGTHQNATTR